MNATQFGELLLIGILCATAGARQLEGGRSEDTKLSISLPKTTTKGVEAELATYSSTDAYNSEYGYARASQGPKGPTGTAYGDHYKSTYGYSYADGPKRANTSSASGVSGEAGARVRSGPRDASASGGGRGRGGSSTRGRSRGR